MNLRSYGSKVKPWIGTWDRKENNYGRDLNGLIYGSDYDSNSGSNFIDNFGMAWDNPNENILKNWIKGGDTVATSTKILNPDAITYEQLDSNH